MRIPKARFVKSVADIKQLPTDRLTEIAVVGRSNVGKSSLINSLFNQKHLAKISSTPGKTRLINYFIIDEKFYLVDLPGYGFSKISKNVSKNWEKLITAYLADNPHLKWVYLLIDCRHNLMDLDRQMINWLTEMEIPFVVILTKSDKLSNNRLAAQTKSIDSELSVVTIITYSAKTHRGRQEIIEMLSDMDDNI
jgi:GTP-binding protein